MFKPRDVIYVRVEYIHDVTKGELLSEKDFDCIGSSGFYSIPLTNYRLELCGTPDKDYTHQSAEFPIDRKITSIWPTLMPVLKQCFIKELAVKWYHAQLYSNFATRYRNIYRMYEFPRIRFERAIRLYIQAAELYKSLVSELLPLFKEEDRETVQYRMLANTAGECIKQLAHELSRGLLLDIEANKKDFGIANIPQETINIWIEYANLVDAWIAEIVPYRRKNQLYRHNIEREEPKTDIKKEVLYTHPDHDPYCEQWFIPTTSGQLKDFLKERALALNPKPSPHEVISIKIHPVTMFFLNSTQKASGLIDRCIHDVVHDDERVNLLDQLEGYNTKYAAPKAANANSVDKGIMLQEKLIMRSLEHLDPLNVAELLQTTNDAIKLLSLVYMRYKMSLEVRDESTYFGFFRAASLIDKDRYYEMFAFYLENIFQKCLPQLLKLTIAKPDAYKDEYKSAVGAVNDLIEFSHDISMIDSTSARRSMKMLCIIQDLCVRENIATGEYDISSSTTGLRQRHIIKV